MNAAGWGMGGVIRWGMAWGLFRIFWTITTYSYYGTYSTPSKAKAKAPSPAGAQRLPNPCSSSKSLGNSKRLRRGRFAAGFAVLA